MAALRFPEKEGRERRAESENLGPVTSPCLPLLSDEWAHHHISRPHSISRLRGSADEIGVERRGKTAINSLVSAPECPANPAAVKPEEGGNETALDTLAHTYADTPAASVMPAKI